MSLFNKDARENQISSSLAEKATYPLIPAETGYTIDKKIQYGNVKRYGAIGDGVADDTSAFQKAIDSSYLQGYEVTVPEGTYRINGTLYLPYMIKIKGVNKARDSYVTSANLNCTIVSYTQYLFRGKNETNNQSTVQLTMEDIFFETSYSPIADSVLFKNIQFKKSYINNITTIGFGTIFYATLETVSIVSNCNFEGIQKYFINSIAETGGFSSSMSTIVDSYIHHNYINGKPDNNITIFNLYSPAHSTIESNFIDFGKYAINVSGSPNAMSYHNNIIDFCYRGFYGVISRSKITCNTFSKTNTAYQSSYPNADNDMKTTDWVCIEIASSGSSNLLIQGNYTHLTTHFARIKGYGIYTMKIIGNLCDTSIVKTVDYAAQKSGITGDVTGLFFDNLMYMDVTTLPNPTLTSTSAGSITTFDKQIVRYQNKLVFNDNGAWKDMIGNLVS